MGTPLRTYRAPVVYLHCCAGMNIFVAFFILLLLLADITPPAASSIPLIGLYSLSVHLVAV